MKNADLPNRKQIRFKEYDYSSPGAYFITICTQKTIIEIPLFQNL